MSASSDVALLAALGFTRPSWWDQAACRGLGAEGIELFFDDTPGVSPRTETARRICAACPVRIDCLTWAVETHQRAGTWGGLTEIERRGLAPETVRDWRRRSA